MIPPALSVNYRETIHGMTILKTDTPIYLFVRSHTDEKWYKQAPVTVMGIHWSGDVAFGFDNSYGHMFSVVALVGDQFDNVYDELPLVEHASAIYTVTRK